MLERWPKVLGEYDTVAKLQEGYSIARYGDGEAKMMRGAEYVREPANAVLAAELRAILLQPDSRCLVGIPTLDKRSPKYPNWKRRQLMFLPYLSPDVAYVSAFITRPDSAPWVETEAFAEAVQSLWVGKKAALVCEPTSKLLPVLKSSARKVEHLVCPSHGASAYLQDYEQRILHSRAEVAVLSHGVSATVLAHRLACKGVQALDLGSIGAMLGRLLAAEEVTHCYPYALRHPEHQSDIPACVAALQAAGFEVLYSEQDRKEVSHAD